MRLKILKLTAAGLQPNGYITVDAEGRLSSDDQVGQNILAQNPGAAAVNLVEKYKGDYLKIVIEESLFVYGTLQESSVQQQIIGRLVAGEPDELPGFTLTQVGGGGLYYPAAIPGQPDDSVRGVVLTMTPPELAQCDRYEGRHYRRRQATLRSGRAAWVYEWGG